MISIILIALIILMIISRRLDIDLDINVTESFDPVTMDEEVEEVAVAEEVDVEDPWIWKWNEEEKCFGSPAVQLMLNKAVYGEPHDKEENLCRNVDVQIFLNDLVHEEEEDEVVLDDCYSGYFQTKRLLTFEEAFDKMQRKYSKRGKHGHKGYTKIQTLAYDKARAFKTSHLNEWC